MTREDLSTHVAQRKFFRSLTMFVLLLISTVVHTEPPESYKVNGDSIIVTKDNQKHICRLDVRPEDVVESYDRSALIVSINFYNGYIPTKDLDNCLQDKPLHVLTIPEKAGVLSDINLNHDIYVALAFVNMGPRYVATVARIGTSKNLVSLKGSSVAYSQKKFEEGYDESFRIDGVEAGAAIISPDGKFVSPDGVIDCSENAFPGVWDIAHNKRVITDKASCDHLFDKATN